MDIYAWIVIDIYGLFMDNPWISTDYPIIIHKYLSLVDRRIHAFVGQPAARQPQVALPWR